MLYAVAKCYFTKKSKKRRRDSNANKNKNPLLKSKTEVRDWFHSLIVSIFLMFLVFRCFRVSDFQIPTVPSMANAESDPS